MNKVLAAVIGAVLLVALVLFLLLRPKATPPPPAGLAADAAPSIETPPPSTLTPPPRPLVDSGTGAATPTLDGGLPKAKGEVLIKAAWGGAPEQFGRKRDPESNPEAPMALVAGRPGEVAIVDQVNRRIERYKDGKLAATLTIGGDTVQDLALGEGGRTVVLDRLADRNVQVYGPDGKLLNEVTLEGKGVPEGGGVTGVFTDDKGIYVERDHTTLVRVADPSGTTDKDRPELPGRPTRDGRLYIQTAIANRETGDLVVRAWDQKTGQPAWERIVPVGLPILHITMLDSDRQGMIYVAADAGRESPQPPYLVMDEAIIVTRLAPNGTPRGQLILPAFSAAEETFRPMTVDDQGNVLMMVPGPGGMTVLRFGW